MNHAAFTRFRVWTLVLYPEHMPEDWLSYLKSTGIPFGLSPLHTHDLNMVGKISRPHYHVFLISDYRGHVATIRSLPDYLNCCDPLVLNNSKDCVHLYLKNHFIADRDYYVDIKDSYNNFHNIYDCFLKTL